jgi:hypothetical protein
VIVYTEILRVLVSWLVGRAALPSVSSEVHFPLLLLIYSKPCWVKLPCVSVPEFFLCWDQAPIRTWYSAQYRSKITQCFSIKYEYTGTGLFVWKALLILWFVYNISLCFMSQIQKLKKKGTFSYSCLFCLRLRLSILWAEKTRWTSIKIFISSIVRETLWMTFKQGFCYSCFLMLGLNVWCLKHWRTSLKRNELLNTKNSNPKIS